MNVYLQWVTPYADDNIAYIARVTNPDAKITDPADKLIGYLLRHHHVSPFEMVNLCVEVNTSRDIARQILRHRSFSFQEFSQRYAAVTEFYPNREARLQDTKNRQNSLPTDNTQLQEWWNKAQQEVKNSAEFYYQAALKSGIAKEVARSVLPEGLTPTRMFINGTIRSWLTYFSVRRGNGTQKEHIEVADAIYNLFKDYLPNTASAWEKHQHQYGTTPVSPTTTSLNSSAGV